MIRINNRMIMLLILLLPVVLYGCATGGKWSELHIDVEALTLEKLKNAISKNGPDYVNWTYENGDTELHRAASEGYEDVIRYLLENGADVNARNKKGRTPLFEANTRDWTNGNYQIRAMELLIKYGADVNVKENDGYTPLFWAITSSLRKQVEILLNAGADANTETNNTTPLEAALRGGERIEIVKLLIDAGADINATNEEGKTMLQVAIEDRNPEIEELLRKRGAKLHARGVGEKTPLHEAAEKGDTEKIERLILDGVNVNAKQLEGWTPLKIASRKGHKEIVKLLVAGGADVNIRDLKGRTSLHEVSNVDTADILIQAGADVNIKDNYDRTPLREAAGRGHREIVELLITKGADVSDQSTYDAETPLHKAAEREHSEIVELLIANGADINARDKNDRTPLHKVVKAGKKGIVEMLVAWGADINAKDDKGATPLRLAQGHGHKEIEKFLIARGAQFNISPQAKRHFDRGIAAAQSVRSPVDYLNAIREFEEAERLAPAWPIVKYNLALAQYHAGNYLDAEMNLNDYIRNSPSASNIEKAKSLSATIEYKRQEANKHFKKGHELFKQAMDNGNWEAAIIEYERALALNPAWALAYSNLGVAQCNAVKYEDALNNLKYCLELEPLWVEQYIPYGHKKKVQGIIKEIEKKWLGK